MEPFYATEGRSAIPARLMLGLHLLKHMYDLSDENVRARWVENPYFQYFCGAVYFQHSFPIERSSMTHFRQRVGKEFCVTLVQESLNAAFQLGALEIQHIERVIVDTTVQPKAITFSTDAKLRYKAVTKLTQLAKEHGIKLRRKKDRLGKCVCKTLAA